MSTGAIVVIAVAAVIIVAGVLALPWMRERSRLRQRQHEVQQRRQRVSADHRQEAEIRDRRAEAAEQRAQIAEEEARRERAEAQRHEERAALHEQGLADDELVAEDEMQRFAGTSAVADRGAAAPVREEPERHVTAENHNGVARRAASDA